MRESEPVEDHRGSDRAQDASATFGRSPLPGRHGIGVRPEPALGGTGFGFKVGERGVVRGVGRSLPDLPREAFQDALDVADAPGHRVRPTPVPTVDIDGRDPALGGRRLDLGYRIKTLRLQN